MDIEGRSRDDVAKSMGFVAALPTRYSLAMSTRGGIPFFVSFFFSFLIGETSFIKEKRRIGLLSPL